MKAKCLSFALLVALSAVTFVSCDRNKPTDSSTSGLASLVCDESFENILAQEVDVFEYNYPNANIIPYYASENAAVDSLLQLKTNMIIVPHELSPDKVEYLNSKKKNVKSRKIAVDAIAIIANNENPIEELSVGELKNILIGKYTDWNDISPNKSGKIMIVFDNQGSSTVKYMRDSVTNGQLFGKNVYAQNSNKEVFEVVRQKKNALGIIGVTWLNADLDGGTANGVDIKAKVEKLERNDTTELASETNNNFAKDLKVVAIRRDDNPIAYKPYQYYIYTGDYPFYRSIYVISTAPGGSLANGFYSFLTGVISQKIILGTGILPAMMPQRNVSLE